MGPLWLLVAELLVVFLGVSLSFFVENLRERRSERRTCMLALRGIADDLSAELPTVEWLISVYRPTAEAGEALYLNWADLPDTAEEPESVLYALHMGAPYTPARAHYEAAKTSGALAQLEDEALQSSIAAVFEQQQGFLRELSRFTVDFDFEFFRRLRPYISYGRSTDTFQQRIVPGEGTMIGGITFTADGASELKSDDVARNSLYMMVIFRRHFAVQLEAYLRTVRELEQTLRAVVTRSRRSGAA